MLPFHASFCIQNRKIHHENTEQKFDLLYAFLIVYGIIENRVIGKY